MGTTTDDAGGGNGAAGTKNSMPRQETTARVPAAPLQQLGWTPTVGHRAGKFLVQSGMVRDITSVPPQGLVLHIP